MNAENSQVQIEQGQALVAFAVMIDAGDHQVFTPAAGDKVFSGKSGKAPTIRPNGIVSGRNLGSVATSGSNDVVDVAAFSAYSKGVEHAVAADVDVAITRAATDVSKINSVTMDETGAIAVVAGVDGEDATFSEVRGAAGGPPLIAVDSVELFQVRMAGNTAAAITADEIFQVVGQHAERFDYPAFDVKNVGDGSSAETSAETNAHVKLSAALPLAHTGAVPKRVYAQYYTPVYAAVQKTLDFVPAEISHSVSSQQFYGGSVGSTSESLGQGGFTALLTNGVADSLVADKNQVLTVKYFPDRNQAAHIITQGKIGISRTFPVSNQIQASVTISAESASVEFTS
jgi:hypothetical protein